MNTKTVKFGENEDKLLEFVDKHWDRVTEFGYDSGWWVDYSITSKVSGTTTRTTVKTSAKGGV